MWEFIKGYWWTISSLKLTEIKGVCDHIMRIRDIVVQLKALDWLLN